MKDTLHTAAPAPRRLSFLPFKAAFLSLLSLGAAVAASAVGLPGGRAYYVVTAMGGAVSAKFVRIAQYTFTAGSGSTGTVTEQFKYWNQSTFTGDSNTNKVLTGYTTNGCTWNCTIKTPKGYQPGQAWSTLSGTYIIDVNGRCVITWTGGQYETWTISSPKSYYSMFTIFNSNYDVQHAWGFGSNTGFSSGATIAQMKSGGTLTNYVYWQNSYGVPDSQNLNGWLDLTTYNICGTSNSMTLPAPPGVPVCDNAYWRSYFAGNPASDFRKTYWQHQLGSVACSDSQGSSTTCISVGGGHTWAMLQVLDDSGVFRGFVGVEASLHAKATGNAVVATAYWVQP
ncbi:MAG: hypothetical protein KF715_18810 [Candidatus Didemnitutus sp.]|nr:hypothetical protein [Candidatus Didemnitutus sp.]